MKASKQQSKSEIINGLIFKCDACGKDICSRCQGKYQYLNGFLCDSCYSSFHDRSTERIRKIKRKRKNRNRYLPFSFEINDVQKLKIGIDALSSLDDNGAIKIYKTELVFSNFDAGRICYSDVKFPEPELKAIIVPKIAEILPLNLTDVKNALESFSGNKKVLLQRKQGKEELLINQIGEKKTITIKTGNFDFEIPDPTNLYKINYTSSFLIEKEKLIEILTNCKIFNTCFILKCTKESITFNAIGGTTQYDHEFVATELEDYTINEESKNEYELEILLSFLERFAEITDTIRIYSKTEYPLKVDINNGQATFFISPRVPYNGEEEDD